MEKTCERCHYHPYPFDNPGCNACLRGEDGFKPAPKNRTFRAFKNSKGELVPVFN